MFEIKNSDNKIELIGRFDASHAPDAREAFAQVATSLEIDCSRLSYISSAGLGVLLGAQKRLIGDGHRLTLTHLNAHIREIFRIAGFDRVFDIE
jgi:anti-sigma B factor antagonist